MRQRDFCQTGTSGQLCCQRWHLAMIRFCTERTFWRVASARNLSLPFAATNLSDDLVKQFPGLCLSFLNSQIFMGLTWLLSVCWWNGPYQLHTWPQFSDWVEIVPGGHFCLYQKLLNFTEMVSQDTVFPVRMLLEIFSKKEIFNFRLILGFQHLFLAGSVSLRSPTQLPAQGLYI